MKFKNLNLLVAAILALMVWSCETSELDGVNANPSTPGEITNNSGLFSNNSVRERVRGFSGYNGPGGFIYSRFNSNSSGRTESAYRNMRHMNYNNNSAARTANDSTQVDCWVESFTETESTYEFTLDFGDGCEVYGEFMKGKLVERGTFTDNTFSSEVEYTGFGGRDWEVSGTESYSGTWIEDTKDSTIWESAYTFTTALIETYTEEGGQSVEVDYQASGSERMDESSFVVESSNETVSVSTGESYESAVDVPLVMDFTCDWEAAYIFVSGIESGSYTYTDETGNAVTGSYSVDYGDGACDNLITVTEDGVSEVIDLSDVWDECEGHDDEDWEDEDWDDEWEDEYYEDSVFVTYEINREAVLSEDGSHYTSGKITLTTDSAEVASIKFVAEEGRNYAILKDEDFGDSDEVEYEIDVPLTIDSGCDYYTAGTLFFYLDDEKIIVEFNTGGTCNNDALVTIIGGGYDDDEEDESGD